MGCGTRMYTTVFVLLFISTVVHSLCNNRTEFTCSNGKCVPLKQRLDLTDHCGDGSDEVIPVCNNSTEFTCKKGNCIPLGQVKDGIDQCGDNSDEVSGEPCSRKSGKPRYTCDGNTQTAEGACINLSFALDGDNDCRDSTASDEKKVIGSPCEVTWCCPCKDYVNNSECRSSKCACVSGTYSNSTGQECIWRRMGDPCILDADCYDAIHNTRCQSVCICAWGYFLSNDGSSCIKRKLGDACTTSRDCSSVIDSSHCNSTCTCNSGYYSNNVNTSCIKNSDSSILGISCIDPSECLDQMPFSDCIHDMCQCSNGYINVNNSYCQARKLGDNCMFNSDCSYVIGNSVCKDGFCACPTTYAVRGGRCVAEHSSDGQEQSESSARDSVGRHCSSNPHRTCSAIGEACFDSLGCLANNSICLNDTCVCQHGFVLRGASQCQTLQIGGNCNYSSECSMVIANSHCERSQCNCINGMKPGDPGKCLQSPDDHTVNQTILDGPCNGDEECSSQVVDSECVDGRCSCITGHRLLGSSCIPTVGSQCLHTDECGDQESTQCIRDTCECESSYRVKPGSGCVRKKLGDRCLFNSECSLIAYESKCINNTCMCVNGINHTRGYDSIACNYDPSGIVSATSSTTTTTITAPTSNTGVQSSCKGQDCVCPAGAKQTDATVCLPVIGSECYERMDCEDVENTDCVRDTCVCKHGYLHDGAASCLPRSIGDSCAFHSECTTVISGSVCRRSTCACRFGMVNGTCVLNSGSMNDLADPDSILGTRCISNVTCLPTSNAFCLSGECRCQNGYRGINDTCILVMNSDCIDDFDCSTVDNTVCVYDKCQCKTGYYGEESRCLRRYLANSCEFDSDCSAVIDNSACERQRCACKFGEDKRQNDSYCSKDDANMVPDNRMTMPSVDISVRSSFDPITVSFAQDQDQDQDFTVTSRSSSQYQDTANITNDDKTDIFEEHGSNSNNPVTESTSFQEGHSPDYIIIIKNGSVGNEIEDSVDPDITVTETMVDFEENSQTFSVPSATTTVHNHILEANLNSEPLLVNGSVVSCFNHTDCAAPNSLCFNDTCRCAKGFRTDDGLRCIQVLSSNCTRRSDCRIHVENSQCIEDYCVCSNGFISDNGFQCRRRVLTDPCTYTSDCTAVIPFSICRGHCTCRPGYKQNNNSKSCEPAPTTKAPTTHVAPHSTKPDGSTSISLQPTRPCHSNRDCFAPSSRCDDVTKTCVPFRFGDNCDDVTECLMSSANATCWDGFCLCNPDRTCHNIEMISTLQCDRTRQCLEHSGTQCSNGRCSCKDGYVLLEDRQSCVPVTLRGLCETNAQCKIFGSDSSCLKGLCVCWDARHRSARLCPELILTKDPPGAATTSDCSSFAECYPWVIALICIAFAIAIFVLFLVIVRYKKKSKRSVSPNTMYADPKFKSPTWTLRPPSRVHTMYENEELREPEDALVPYPAASCAPAATAWHLKNLPPGACRRTGDPGP